ncbi:MAG: arylamine N-acetyltransferase [Candidatus Dormibacteria bacterium]
MEDGDPLAPTAATLARLHRAHATHIPFENLDIHLGRPIRLDLAAIEAKLVRRRRGGYCFEQNALFAAVLRQLGYDVVTLAARVHLGKPTQAPPRTHMLLAVHAEGVRYLCDVGFGCSTPLEPVEIRAGGEAVMGCWTYRVLAVDRGWRLQLRRPDGWLDLYEFTDEPQHPVDYEVANHYTSTHPASSFVRLPTAQLPGADVQVALRGLEMAYFTPEGMTTETVGSGDELLAVLANRFGLVFAEGTRFRSPHPGTP